MLGETGGARTWAGSSSARRGGCLARLWAGESARRRADARAGGMVSDLRLVVFGGEALDPASLAPWFERHGEKRPLLVNMYGITETTVHTTWRLMRQSDLSRPGSAIGRPLSDLPPPPAD